MSCGVGARPSCSPSCNALSGIRLLPFEKEPLRRADGAVDGALPAGAHEDLRRLEQLRRALVLPARVGLLVAVKLLDRFGLPGVADGRTLALDHRERQAVDEGDDIRDDVLLRPVDPELPGHDPLVAVRVVEVEEPNRVALASIAAVLLQGDAVGEGGVERLVGLGETGRRDLGDGSCRLGQVGVGEPGVQPLEGLSEAAGEDGLLEAGAFAFEVFRRDVGVAEGLEEFDGGVFRRGGARPSRWSWGSCGRSLGVFNRPDQATSSPRQRSTPAPHLLGRASGSRQRDGSPPCLQDPVRGRNSLVLKVGYSCNEVAFAPPSLS